MNQVINRRQQFREIFKDFRDILNRHSEFHLEPLRRAIQKFYDLGLTQKQVADILGFSTQYINQIYPKNRGESKK